MELSLGLVLWVVAFAVAIVAIVLGAILSYHWIRYAMNSLVATIAIGIYAAGAGALIVTMFAAAAAFSL